MVTPLARLKTQGMREPTKRGAGRLPN
ncbi:hypothetical protein C356_05194 [Cryptococcus neoformans c45]|nr:hypothetical protein C356_05194 [Cryptococcus neoformans var. grubii c45]